jgi:hypothetical protein
MIEELVFARTGKTYVQFVQDEILPDLPRDGSRQWTLDGDTTNKQPRDDLGRRGK